MTRVIAILWGRDPLRLLRLPVALLKWYWGPSLGHVGLREWGLGMLGEGWLWRRHQYPGRVANHTTSRRAADAAGVCAAVLVGDLWQDQFSRSAVG